MQKLIATAIIFIPLFYRRFPFFLIFNFLLDSIFSFIFYYFFFPIFSFLFSCQSKARVLGISRLRSYTSLTVVTKAVYFFLNCLDSCSKQIVWLYRLLTESSVCVRSVLLKTKERQEGEGKERRENGKRQSKYPYRILCSFNLCRLIANQEFIRTQEAIITVHR